MDFLNHPETERIITAAFQEDVLGSIEVGKQADIIQVAFDDVHHVPTYDVISHLVYVSDEQGHALDEDAMTRLRDALVQEID